MNYLLTDAQWGIALLLGRKGTKGGRGQDNRRFVEAVLWLVRHRLPVAGFAASMGQLAHHVYALSALDGRGFPGFCS
jgi:hypothetical protein